MNRASPFVGARSWRRRTVSSTRPSIQKQIVELFGDLLALHRRALEANAESSFRWAASRCLRSAEAVDIDDDRHVSAGASRTRPARHPAKCRRSCNALRNCSAGTKMRPVNSTAHAQKLAALGLCPVDDVSRSGVIASARPGMSGPLNRLTPDRFKPVWVNERFTPRPRIYFFRRGLSASGASASWPIPMGYRAPFPCAGGEVSPKGGSPLPGVPAWLAPLRRRFRPSFVSGSRPRPFRCQAAWAIPYSTI